MSSSRSCRAVAGRVAAQHVPPPPMMQPSPVRARSQEPGARSPGPTLSKMQTACTDQGAPQGGRVHVQTGPGRPVAACTSKPDPDSMRQMRRSVPPSWARVALGQFAGLPSQRRGRRAHGPLTELVFPASAGSIISQIADLSIYSASQNPLYVTPHTNAAIDVRFMNGNRQVTPKPTLLGKPGRSECMVRPLAGLSPRGVAHDRGHHATEDY